MELRWSKGLGMAGFAFAGIAALQALASLFGLPSVSSHTLHDGVMLAGGIALLVVGFAFLHKKRAIENVPRSRIRSVAMGFAELTGRARARITVVAPLSGISCVFFKYRIEQEESNSRGGTTWKTVDSGQSADWFDLDDGTGTIAVDPDGVEADLGRDLRTIERGEGFLARKQRLTEWRVHPSETVTLIGTVRKLRSLVQERKEALHDRLQALKRDPARLRPFDTDHDGRISTEEWGNVVRVAQDDLLRAAVAAQPGPPADDLIIGRGAAETTFIISDKGERALVRSLSLKAGLALAAGAALTVAASYSLFVRPGAGGSGLPW